MLNKIIILGKPNVGKSSIFNLIVKKNIALVDDMPGLTRDVRRKNINLWDKNIEIIDSPGLTFSKNKLEKQINEFTLNIVNECELVLLVIDLKNDLTNEDHNLIKLVRKLNKKIILVFNKFDIKKKKNHIIKGFNLEVFVSATHNIGIDELKWEIYKNVKIIEDTDSVETQFSVAIVGKTNTGKSTIFNLLNKKLTSQTSELPFMTRDTVESNVNLKNLTFKAFDTAGFSKGSKSHEKVNKISIQQTLKKIRLCQMILVVLDINDYYERINSKIINLVYNENRCLLILVNKVDTKSFVKKEIENHIYELNPQIKGSNICFVSALKNYGFNNFDSILVKQLKSWQNRIKTSELNSWLNYITNKNPHPLKNGNLVKFKFITQINIAPPKFFIFTNHPDFISTQYKRYLSNNLKNNFNLHGLPIKIIFKKSINPYEKN